jgi:hypothetical protein
MGGRVLVGLLAAGLALAACGGSGDSAETTTSAVSAATTTSTATFGDDGDSSVGTTGGGFVDEPLPTIEQLENAPGCDELNRFMAGVENENFRMNADRTDAEEQAQVEDEFDTDFDIEVYQVAFSDRQGDLGCSDAEIMSVLETAFAQLCDAWIADGHDLDEDPLLLNTADCLDN